MLKNYFVVALRALSKNGIYSIINIGGLSVGIASCILILLWVSHELSYDNFHQNKDQLYRVYVNGQGDQGIYTQMAVPLPLWEEFKHNQPGVKHVAPTNWGQTFLLTYGDQRLFKRGYYAGDEFLKMFSFPLIKGNVDQQLSDPSTIVLTRSTALALFGDDDAIGKIIRVDDKLDLTVSGIMEDVPSNSSFEFECLLPFTTYMNREPWVKDAQSQWGNNSFNLYVQFEETVDPEALEDKVKGVIKKHEAETEDEITFLSMDRWRLYSGFRNGKSVTGAIEYVIMFTIIAVFILVIACINFMNLATARSERRAREVGIRKSIGSRRKELIFQFMGETFLISFIAFVIAIGLVEISLPFYNTLVNKNLTIDYLNPRLYVAAVSLIAFTGFLAGSYPALYLSSFNPAAVLKGIMGAGKKGATPRKAMVILQFFFSILLMISTTVIYNQINHLKDRPTGYDQSNLMIVSNNGDVGKNFSNIKNELINKGLAESVTTSSSPITAIYSYQGNVEWKGRREDQRPSFATVAVNHDYTRTMGIKMLEGRDFSHDFADSSSMIINKAAVDYMGLTHPLGETVRVWNRTYEIVGVMDDVLMVSATRAVDPLLVILDPTWASDLTIRTSSSKGLSTILPDIEQIFRKYNPAYPFEYRFADDEFNQKFADIQRIGYLSNLFSALAILISCLGLFGLAAFTAEQRTKEIGIRKVLGATISNVVILISKDFTKLVLLAFVLAAPAAFYLMSSWLEQYEYRISIEWWILAFAGLLALSLALTVVSYQAIKAATANPVNSLRSE